MATPTLQPVAAAVAYTIETRSVDVILPVHGGNTFVHFVDGAPMLLKGPEGMKWGEKHTFVYAFNSGTSADGKDKPNGAPGGGK